MKRREGFALMAAAGGASLLSALAGCAAQPGAVAGAVPAVAPRGSNDLGLVIERAVGRVAVVDTTHPAVLARIAGLGDLSHASVVFARDGARAYVFGRDGAVTRVNLLTARIEARVLQAGNSIGGAISQDGRLVAAQNYQPGGVKVFDAETLDLVADIPALGANGQRSRVVASTASAASLTTHWSRPTAATSSPACSAKTAWRCWTCGPTSRGCGAC